MIEIYVFINGEKKLYLGAKPKKGHEGEYDVFARNTQLSNVQKKIGEISIDESDGIASPIRQMVDLLEESQ